MGTFYRKGGQRPIRPPEIADYRLQTDRERQDRKTVYVDEAAIGWQLAQKQVVEDRHTTRFSQHVACTHKHGHFTAGWFAKHIAVRSEEDGLRIVEQSRYAVLGYPK